MKQIISPVVTLVLFMTIAACKKEINTTVNGTTLSASKTNSIKRGEPVLFTLVNNSTGSANWKVSPALNTQINATGNSASIMFGSTGTYTVTAVSGNSTDSSVVTVLDSVYTPPVISTVLPLISNEQINITASKLDSASYSGLILFAETDNTYTCLGNSLISQVTSASNSYTIDFTGVSVPAGCTSGSAKAGTFEYFVPMSDGTNTLTITLNGTSYTGSVVKAGSSYAINWSYTNGVIISPSTL